MRTIRRSDVFHLNFPERTVNCPFSRPRFGRGASFYPLISQPVDVDNFTTLCTVSTGIVATLLCRGTRISRGSNIFISYLLCGVKRTDFASRYRRRRTTYGICFPMGCAVAVTPTMIDERKFFMSWLGYK